MHVEILTRKPKKLSSFEWVTKSLQIWLWVNQTLIRVFINQSVQQNACCAVWGTSNVRSFESPVAGYHSCIVERQTTWISSASCSRQQRNLKLSSKCPRVPGVDLDLDKFNLSDVDHMGSWAACSGGAESLEARVQLGKVSRQNQKSGKSLKENLSGRMRKEERFNLVKRLANCPLSIHCAILRIFALCSDAFNNN